MDIYIAVSPERNGDKYMINLLRIKSSYSGMNTTKIQSVIHTKIIKTIFGKGTSFKRIYSCLKKQKYCMKSLLSWKGG